MILCDTIKGKHDPFALPDKCEKVAKWQGENEAGSTCYTCDEDKDLLINPRPLDTEKNSN